MLLPILRNTEDWLDNSFENIFNDNWMPTMSTAAPAINVKENDKEYDVEVAAPGACKEDFNVNLDNDGNLVIKMEHKDEKKDENRGSSESHQACLNGRVANEDGKANKKEHYLRREFASCNYEQALSLPEDVEKDKIGAKVENGVLHITLPRTAKAEKETKRIEVA